LTSQACQLHRIPDWNQPTSRKSSYGVMSLSEWACPIPWHRGRCPARYEIRRRTTGAGRGFGVSAFRPLSAIQQGLPHAKPPRTPSSPRVFCAKRSVFPPIPDELPGRNASKPAARALGGLAAWRLGVRSLQSIKKWAKADRRVPTRRQLRQLPDHSPPPIALEIGRTCWHDNLDDRLCPPPPARSR
jgi:hypothetical protein